MLSLANVGVIMMSFVGTLFCHFISPYIHKRIWRNYGILHGVEKCEFDSHFGATIAGVLCIIFASVAFISDPHFHQLGLVGSSTAGNVALDIIIGQYIADVIFQWIVTGTYGSKLSMVHHISVIGSAIAAHNFFHRLAVYRFIHLFILPFVTIYEQMVALKYDISSGLFKCVMLINSCVFFLVRMAVIPFHWIWYVHVFVTSRNEWSMIWPLAWPVLIACSILIDCISCIWGGSLLKDCIKELRKVKRED